MARKKERHQEPPKNIETVIEGRRYSGTYRIEDGGIRVTLSGGGSKWVRSGGMSTETLARIVLGELVREEQQRS